MCALMVMLSIFTKAQNITVTGTVLSGEDHQPMIGVNVVLLGTDQGTSTDFNGMYSLEAPPDGVDLGDQVPGIGGRYGIEDCRDLIEGPEAGQGSFAHGRNVPVRGPGGGDPRDVNAPDRAAQGPCSHRARWWA